MQIATEISNIGTQNISTEKFDIVKEITQLSEQEMTEVRYITTA